jgi:putative ABC transport system ATP-binding protein
MLGSPNMLVDAWLAPSLGSFAVMPDAAAPLATRSLSRVVDGAVLVTDVTIEVEAGDVFVVFGPSGAGKSTLLRLLNRLDEPTAGTVLLDGVDYRTLDPRTVRRRVGLVPQQPALIDGTVAENVTWGPRLRDAPVDLDRMRELLDRLGLAGFEDRDAGALSGGEAQRVAIARTLFNDPDVVLLDEPAASLDATAAERVESLLADVMAAYSLTAVLVTHDAERARRLGTRGVRLDAGRVVRDGPIQDVIASLP